MTNTRLLKIHLLSILAILSLSTTIPALAYAAPLAVSDKDWEYSTGNSWAQNYSPQTQINKDNVDQLEVKWLFLTGGRATAAAGLQALSLQEGIAAPPVVKDGIVAAETNYLAIYAMDAKTGKQLWVNNYDIDIEAMEARLPIDVGSAHLHGFRYWSTEDVILAVGLACDFYAVDFRTGETKWTIGDLCLNIEGSIYKYTTSPSDQNVVGTYERGRMFTYTLKGNTGRWSAKGRNTILAIDMDSHQIVQRIFNQPPQDRPVKDWALQECDIGWFQDIPCSEVREKNREGLEWDWAPVPGEPAHWSAGVSANWGTPVIDEDTGYLYVNTGNQSPYTNTSMTPGPRLYGSVLEAIDLNTGKRIWWHQPFPHDPWDYDCNWSGILIDHPQLGKVYTKGCKDGWLYVVDALTGDIIHFIDVVEEQWPGERTSGIPNPFSNNPDPRGWDHGPEHSLRLPWGGYPKGTPDEPFSTLVPGYHHGTFGTDMSYDPTTGTLFHIAQRVPYWKIRAFPMQEGKRAGTRDVYTPLNSSIVARDIVTGQVKWTWFYPYSINRANMIITGGMVVAPMSDGYVRFYDQETGQMLREISLGAGILTGPAVGKDSDGNSKIFVVVGPGRNYVVRGVSPQVPGTIVALGLSEKAAAEVRTTTVTTTTTSRTTATVTSTSATTVTSQVTEEVGLPSTVTYAAVAIAVIAIIAAAILATRRRP